MSEVIDPSGPWIVAWNDELKYSHTVPLAMWDLHRAELDGYVVIAQVDSYEEAADVAFEQFKKSRALRG